MVTFGFGIASTFVWLKFNPRIYKYEEVISADVPKTKYCDLVNNSYKYDGKIVRVDANLCWYDHGYFLEDLNCSSEDESSRTAIIFNKENREEIWNSLEKHKKPGELWKPLEIIAVGVFRYKFSSGGSDHIADRTLLHFEIYNLEYSAR